MEWCIFYGDGSRYSSLGEPQYAPARDVQLIVIKDPDHKWRTASGCDYYVWDDRGDGYSWWGVDHNGLYDYWIEPGWKRILQGRSITSRQFQKLFNAVQDDSEWGRKTAFYPNERKP